MFKKLREINQHVKGYINDEHSSHIFYPYNREGLERKIEIAGSNMYELVGEYAFIKDYLAKYNDLKFLTVCSQPGKIVDWIPHKYTGEDKFEIKCKAFVIGYMNRNRFRKIQKRLRSMVEDKHIIGIREFTKDKPTGLYPILSQSFKNGVETKPICSKCTNEKGVMYVRSPHIWMVTKSFRFTMDKLREYLADNGRYYKDGDNAELTPVIFFDRRFNENSSLWKTLLELLEKI